MAVQHPAAGASKVQVAVRSAVTFGAIVLTMSIWWPAGIVVALMACGAATVLANRMIQAAGERSDVTDMDPAVLFAPFVSDDALEA